MSDHIGRIVGDWRIAVDDATPQRGQEIRVSARSLEPLGVPA